MVPRGHCYSVQHDQLEHQVTEVFWYFNVDQDDKYLFSRCQKCNGDKYAVLTSYQVGTKPPFSTIFNPSKYLLPSFKKPMLLIGFI